MSDRASLKAVVYGRVQGVFFRAFVERRAASLGLTGYVRNLPGGRSVEVQAEGDKKKIEELLRQLKTGPPGARVEDIVTDWSDFAGKYSDFEIKY